MHEILEIKYFTAGPMHVIPGDTLMVSVDGIELVRHIATEEATYNCSILVRFSEETCQALGLVVGSTTWMVANREVAHDA